jgi:energy-coupling factor transporter transmembrane protein EcfT
MKLIANLFPFMPQKGDQTKLIVGLIFYALLVIVAIPIVVMVLTFTVVFALLIPILIPLLFLYSVVGFIFTILHYSGKMDLSKYKNKNTESGN